MPVYEKLPGQYHPEVMKGDAYRQPFDFNFDLTDYTIVATIHPKDGSDVVLAIEETDLSAGQFSIVLTAAQSATLAIAYHSWCLVMTPPGSPPEPLTYLAGRFIVKGCS